MGSRWKALLLLSLACAARSPVAAQGLDDLLWLEAPRNQPALQWAREQTRLTRANLLSRPSHAGIAAGISEALAGAAPTSVPVLLGNRMLRLMRTQEHPHGLLQGARRRTDGLPGAWRTLLDVDALRRAEGQSWELAWTRVKDACLPPAYERCLLQLSLAGSDEAEVREFDLETGSFVVDGFRIPASLGYAVWLDHDSLLVTHSPQGAPRTAGGMGAAVKLWHRGERLETARTVFLAGDDDADLMLTSAGGHADRRGVAIRAIDYSHFNLHLIDRSGAITPVDLPQELKPLGVLATTDRHLIVQLARSATIQGTDYPAESILSYDMLPTTAADARVRLLYAPRPDEVPAGSFLGEELTGVAGTSTDVHLVVTRDHIPRVVRATPGDDGWSLANVVTGELGQSFRFAQADVATEVLLITEGFLVPRRAEVMHEGRIRRRLASEPAAFDTSRFVVEVRSVTSRDGVLVEYYLVRPRRSRRGEPVPTLLTGYGAFGVSFTPAHLDDWVGGVGFKLWFDRGGALAVPLIRGGGERGTAWHQAALRTNRQRSYDDFLAVAQSLIDARFTRPERLGVFGASNGGLLAAVAGTQRPDLFAAIVCDVPLTDMLRFPSMGMGALWKDEYGDPDDPAMIDVLRAYSPLHAVRDGTRYPPFLVTISTSDIRVGPGHARKFVKRLQDAGAIAFLYEDEEGGHDVSDALLRPDLMAVRMTFLIDALTPGAR